MVRYWIMGRPGLKLNSGEPNVQINVTLERFSPPFSQLRNRALRDGFLKFLLI